MRPRSAPLRLRARTAFGLLGLAVASAALASAPASAERPARRVAAAPAAPALAPPSPDLPGLPDTSIELARVPVESPEFDEAAARYGEADAAHTAARARRHDLDQTMTVLHGRARELDAISASTRARMAGLSARLEAIEGAIQQLAVAAFVVGTEDERLDSALVSETPSISEGDRRAVIGGLTMDVLLAERAAYRARLEAAEARADDARAELAEVRDSLQDLGSERPDAVRREVDEADEVADERVRYEEARVLATVDGVEFPLVALDAYYRAADSIAEERPTCGVRWWGIAGISRVEGRHGTYGGTELRPNGDTTRRIIGIQLNGTNETAVVGDSDGGTLDGDPAFDRAVGPMQFIPQTWSRYQADGNEDGTTSPFNLYDATLAAAKYLCTSSSGLDADPGLRSAYFSYNHSLPYVDAVLGYARLYERAIDIPDPEDRAGA
jgi:membrane-bound lytic murein transglycosylase B